MPGGRWCAVPEEPKVGVASAGPAFARVEWGPGGGVSDAGLRAVLFEGRVLREPYIMTGSTRSH